MTSASLRGIRVLPRKAKHGDTLDVVEHLDELRRRLFVIIGALAVGLVAGYIVHGHVVHALNDMLPAGHRRPITFGVAESFMTSLKVSFYTGLVLTSPIVMWQIWGFFAPVVEERKQRGAVGFVFMATILALCGIAVGYFVVLPAAVSFLLGFDNNLYNIQIRAQDYLSFATMVMLAMALVFELPIFILGLVRFRILTSHTLRTSRRMGYAACAVLSAALPGADIVTISVEFFSLLFLYELSIWLSVFFEPRWKRSDAKAFGDVVTKVTGDENEPSLMERFKNGDGLWGK